MSYEVVYVEWLDSVSYGSGVWVRKEDATGHDAIGMLCRSVGFLIEEDDHQLNICAHDSGSEFSGQMAIPKVAIQYRRTISKAVAVKTRAAK